VIRHNIITNTMNNLKICYLTIVVP